MPQEEQLEPVADRDHAIDLLTREVARREHAERELTRRYRERMDELRMAADFQRGILPALPELPWLELALRYQPAETVSGDVYDLTLNREGELGLLVGDATGHGLVAAFMTMLVHSALDGIRRDLSTSATLARLNEQLAERSTGRSVSAVFWRVSPSGLLRCAHAGHPPLLVVRTNGDLVSLHEGGCALGMFGDEPVPYREEQVQLDDGDLVLAYTDGVSERRSGCGEHYGTGRMIDYLTEHRSDGIETILDGLTMQARAFAGGRDPEDDATLLACRFRARTH